MSVTTTATVCLLCSLLSRLSVLLILLALPSVAVAQIPPNNVQAFGAVGDGVTDDTAAFQAALDFYRAGTNRSGSLIIPCGAYRITNTLVYEGAVSYGLRLEGCLGGTRGPSGARLVWYGHPGAGMFYFLGANALTIENVEIQSNAEMKWGIYMDATNEYASTVTVNTTSLSRISNIVTVTTATGITGLASGHTIRITGATDATFNGTFIVLTVPTATTATYIHTGPNGSTSGGTTAKHKSSGSSGSVIRRVTVNAPRGLKIAISGTISRDGVNGSVTTVSAHYLVPGDTVHVDGVTDTTFNNYYTVSAVTSATAFTYTDSGRSASSSGGTVITDSSGILFGHSAATTEQVDLVAMYDLAIIGRADGTSLHGINWNQAGNVKNYGITRGVINGCDYGVDWAKASGALTVWGLVIGESYKADFVTGSGSLSLIGVASESLTGDKFVIGSTGSNHGELTIIGSTWQGATSTTDDMIIQYTGSVTLIGNYFQNTRTSSSLPLISIGNPQMEANNQSSVTSIGNFYRRAPTGYIPVVDGGGNFVVSPGSGTFANKSVQVLSLNDTGGDAGALVKLKNIIPLDAILSQKASTTRIPSSGFLRLAAADVAKIANNAGNADLNLLSKGTDDVVQVGDTAGIKAATLQATTVNTTAPAAGDCDAAGETGKYFYDSTNDNLYVCSGVSGWRVIATVAP